jgi:hypothetical protein
MYPVLPVEWMAEAIQFMYVFFGLLAAVFGGMLARQ